MAFALLAGVYLAVVGFASLIPRIMLIAQNPSMRAENSAALVGHLVVCAIGVLLVGEFNRARKRLKATNSAPHGAPRA